MRIDSLEGACIVDITEMGIIVSSVRLIRYRLHGMIEYLHGIIVYLELLEIQLCVCWQNSVMIRYQPPFTAAEVVSTRLPCNMFDFC